MNNLDLDKINKEIADRSDVFYWQTDRNVSPEEAGLIWADRHNYFDDQELLERINLSLPKDKLSKLLPLDMNAQTNLGNVSSVRAGVLESGKEVIIRCFPKGVKNGYFHVEKLAADLVRKHNMPSYITYAIHDVKNEDDLAFHVIEKMSGDALQRHLESYPEDEVSLVFEIGSMLARVNKIEVDGFGPFDNENAKNGELKGVHNSLESAMNAALDFNLGVLVAEELINTTQANSIKAMFQDNKLLKKDKAYLIHNDFADWNVLVDGKKITAILDFDECVGGDPIQDIACWSTFFDPDRLELFLDGYWSVVDKPTNFLEKFELFRLRYIISKMTLRIRKYNWEKSEFIKEKIEKGSQHLAESLKYFGI